MMVLCDVALICFGLKVGNVHCRSAKLKYLLGLLYSCSFLILMVALPSSSSFVIHGTLVNLALKVPLKTESEDRAGHGKVSFYLNSTSNKILKILS